MTTAFEPRTNYVQAKGTEALLETVLSWKQTKKRPRLAHIEEKVVSTLSDSFSFFLLFFSRKMRSFFAPLRPSVLDILLGFFLISF